MTREDIIRLAREAGFGVSLPSVDYRGKIYGGDDDNTDEMERFAALVAAEEREECDHLIKGLLKANEAFAKRQEWWTERMFELIFELEKQLGEAVLAEREACALEVERARPHMDGILELNASTYFIASRVTDYLAGRIRARGVENDTRIY